MKFTSNTHSHLFACINTIIVHENLLNEVRPIRILDVGCGNGIMLSSIIKAFKEMYPHANIQYFGLDVDDSPIQMEGYFEKTIQLLSSTENTVNWSEHLQLLKSTDVWPYPENYFDVILSNQVMEHVLDHKFVFNQIERTLHQKGYSLHQYPLKHYIYEGYLFIPFVHKFKSWSTTYKWIKLFSFLRIGLYKQHKAKGIASSISYFSRRHADYLSYHVNYKTAKQTTDIAKSVGLRSSFDFIAFYYTQKIRSILRLKVHTVYPSKSINSFSNSLIFFFLKYISGITLVLRKYNSYISE